MLSTPEKSIDYLKVPMNDGVGHSTPHHSSSFIIQSDENDKHIASNLSLPLIGHSILKQGNSSSRRPSTSSHLSVHYSPTTIETDEKIEFIPSLIVPQIESSLLIENQNEDIHSNKRHFFQMPINDGLHKLLRNPLLYGRYDL